MIIIAVCHIYMWKEINNQPKLESASQETKRQERMKKVSTTFQIIFMVYFLMTLPHSVSILVYLYCLYYKTEYLQEHRIQLINWSDGTLYFLVLNSCINAFIYGKAYSKVWKYCKQRRGSAYRSEDILLQ